MSMFKRLLLIMAMSVALGACAQKLPDSSRYPHFNQPLNQEISVAVSDHREFILNNDKEPWFEGIMHGTLGIPHSLKRIGPSEGKPFAFYLSTMLQESLAKPGNQVKIIEVPMGTKADELIKTLKDNGTAGILLIIKKSRYAFWMTAEYRYEFDVIIVDRTGSPLVQKTFAEWEEKMPLSSKYNVFDMFTEIYTQKLQKIIDDKEIAAALRQL